MIYYNDDYDEWTAIRERAKRAESELNRVKAELLAVKVTAEHTFAAQRIAEADVEELKKELEKRDAVIKEMREALAALVDESPKSDILCDDGFTLSYQKNSRVHKRALEALARAKEAGL